MCHTITSRPRRVCEPDTVARLAEVSNIVGIKEASGDIDQASQIRALTDSSFSIYSGDDSLTLPLLSVGAEGVVSVASHLVGDQIQAMIQSYEQGDVQVARSTHLKLFPLFKVLFASPNPIPVKQALKLQGHDVGSTRLPLVSSDAELDGAIRSVLQQLDLL